MAIDWNRVTKFSQIIAIVLFLAVFGWGYWLGDMKGQQEGAAMSAASSTPTDIYPAGDVINDVTYACDDGKNVRAIYRQESVELVLSDGRHLSVPQAISADGGRYANADESFVFWNKGTGAFITEGTGANSTTTFANCAQVPEPTPGQG